MGIALLQTFRQQHSGLSVEAVLHLRLDVPVEEELASTWLIAWLPAVGRIENQKFWIFSITQVGPMVAHKNKHIY